MRYLYVASTAFYAIIRICLTDRNTKKIKIITGGFASGQKQEEKP
jgi:hypothetical protein